MKPLAIAAIACALLACVKNESKPSEPEARADDAKAAPVAAAPTVDAHRASPPPVSKVDCPMMSALIGTVRDTRVAMNPQAAFKLALADWQAVPEECRDGRWHMLAAQLLRTGYAESITAGDHSFDSPSRALADGLAREPNSPELLELVAYLSAVSPDTSPELPADACDRVPAGTDEASRDLHHYVCGHAALRNRDPRKAATELAAVANRRVYPDLELRTAIALLRSDDRAAARAAAEAVANTTVQSALAFGATEAEFAALTAQAKELIASL